MACSKKLVWMFPLMICARGLAQDTAVPTEKGSFLFYADGGWSFGLPAVRASVGPVISPERKILPAPAFGAGITAWKNLVPFVDFTFYDTGKATASIGSVSSQAQADTWSFHGGLRAVAGKSRIRGYAEIGGGILYQSLNASFSSGIQAQPANLTGSASSIMYGGGVQFFVGRRWGSDLGFDGFHVGQPINGGSQNFSRVRIGLFFQTKSTIP